MAGVRSHYADGDGMVRLLAVDPITLARVGYAAAVSTCSDITLAGTAASAAEARELVISLEPHVVTVDAWLPDGDGLTFAAQLRAERTALGVVLLGPADDDMVFRALDAGVSAMVPRQSTIAVLMSSVRHAASAPNSFTAPHLTIAVARRSRKALSLTSREIEVLKHLHQGASVPAIAAALRVADPTVRTYLRRIYQKLGANDRTQAVHHAQERGVLE